MPFSGATQAKLFRNIQLGVFEFHPAYWKDVSEEAKDLISSLIEGFLTMPVAQSFNFLVIYTYITLNCI